MRRRLPDAWRLSVGTLTAIPVKAPARVDRDTAGLAMVLAPLAVVPLGALVALALWGGRELNLAPVGFIAVGALALGSRAFHLDGLADTADGLTASYDRERSLSVMKSGSVGPAGVVALVLVLMIQAAGFGTLAFVQHGAIAAGVLVCTSRVALTLTCVRGVPSARPEGLGASHAGSVPRLVALATWLAAAAVSAAAADWTGLTPWWHMLIAMAVAAAVVGLLVLRATRRLGGVTGDIFGAAIELTLAILLLAVTPTYFGAVG
jgi:adenosylcobinamide-GDP ribazoletransferase